MPAPHRILLVDDNPDEISLGKMALDRLAIPLEIQVATDGRQAINKILQKNNPPALVLLDLNLPLLSGLDVLRHVRQTHPRGNLPIIMLTTSRDPKDKTRAEALECDEFHVKPLSFQESVSLLGDILHRWLPRLD